MKKDKIEFQKTLFRSAVLVMACDGEIHDDEIKEIEIIFRKSNYFKELDFESELNSIIDEFNENEKEALEDYFSGIRTNEYSPVQQLQILEIMLRIVYADNRLDENEVKFLQLTQSLLGVHNEILVRRFGQIDFLVKNQFAGSEKLNPSNFIDQLDLSGLQAISIARTSEEIISPAQDYNDDLPEIKFSNILEKNSSDKI